MEGFIVLNVPYTIRYRGPHARICLLINEKGHQAFLVIEDSRRQIFLDLKQIPRHRSAQA